MLEPLSGKLTTDESKFNGVLDQLTAEDGNYYAVPFRSDFWVVYYNKDIFDQAGIEYPTNDMTMADFDAKIREVYEKTGIYGQHLPHLALHHDAVRHSGRQEHRH